MTRAGLVHDLGPGVGLGHQSRMRALTPALEALGMTVSTATDPAAAAGADVTVVDSYRWRADDRRVFGEGPVVALDDLYRDLDVQLVVDPSPGAEARRHRRAVRVLAGPSYALLSLPSDRMAAGRGRARTVLVTTGAADAAGVGREIAAGLRAADPDVRIRLVIGPWGAADVPRGVEAVHSPQSLVDEIRNADVVVTAAGVTLLESLALGRATVTVVLSENQRRAAVGAADAGAAVLADVEDVVDRTIGVMADPSMRARLRAAGPVLVDGRGPQRVAEAVRDLI